jgi:hypothetical protein
MRVNHARTHIVTRANFAARDRHAQIDLNLIKNRKIPFTVQQSLKRYIVDNIADIAILQGLSSKKAGRLTI